MRGARRRSALEARAEHPGARTLTSRGNLIVGIDLGTTNTALAWSDGRSAIRTFDVPQLVRPGESGRHPTLPSFLYLATEEERSAGTVRLPWDPRPEIVVGLFAREHGALVHSRQVSSAKSWLSNAMVDRTAPLLPWGHESGPHLSPVQASARILAHLRDAWNEEHPERRLQDQDLVLTVPASFDDEARELTVAAAREAGLAALTLLEEPLAALYAWIATHRHALGDTFGDRALILVCDVGGGTTDFSLIRASTASGDLEFERIAIGDHLLLGGDNLDLALAAAVEQKLGPAARLTLSQRQVLLRKCSAAKETLLTGTGADRVPITILGAGRGVVSGGLAAELTRDEVARVLSDGFLPITAPGDVPARDRRPALRELGLPYETEPAITRHLAAFLQRAGRTGGTDGPARPGAVLFNGGFFTPALARSRVLDTLAHWFGDPPRVLENERPESAVAIGAAFYARLRRDPAASRRLLIRAGTARTYYIGVQGAEGSATTAVCVVPRGTQEGTRIDLDREFSVTANQPAAFTLYSSLERRDDPNAIVTLDVPGDAHRHAPLVTALRYGKRSRRVPIDVALSAVFTETGTLELWCRSTASDHRWRLAFNLRSVEADPFSTTTGDERPEADDGSAAVVVSAEGLDRALALAHGVFGGTSALDPAALTGEIEAALGHGRSAWPLEVIRKLADVLLDVAGGRLRSAAHEVRWLNLTGFCMRPGIGSSLDEWRIGEIRKVYAAGLAFPREVQSQVEWLVLWQRVAAGFSTGQQRELAQRVSGQLGVGQRKPPRVNPQVERESWRLLAGLERLDVGQRVKLGDELLERVRRDPRNSHWLWAIGRFGARVPLYGPLNAVVGPAVATRWVERLMTLKEVTPDVAAAVIQIAARTGDPARDLPDPVREEAAARLQAAGVPAQGVEGLFAAVPVQRLDASRVFGESLPHGLTLRPASGAVQLDGHSSGP